MEKRKLASSSPGINRLRNSWVPGKSSYILLLLLLLNYCGLGLGLFWASLG